MSQALDYLAQDIASRDLIRTLLDETLFVEAGAGTGKTSALVDRYVSLILAGREVDEIVAITFTEKAAAELRDRVRGELERRLAEGKDPPLLLQNALANLDRAHISTIHAFALFALRAFAAESGINPTFAVQDEVAAERRFEDAWHTYLDDLGQDAGAARSINRLLELGLYTRNLETLAHELWRHTAMSQLIQQQPFVIPEVHWPDLNQLQYELAELQVERAPADDRLRPAVEKIARAVDQLIASPDEDRDALLANLMQEIKPPGKIGRQDNWGGSTAINQVRETADNAANQLLALLGDLRTEALATAMPLFVRFVTDEASRRLRDGDVLFDDLILQLRNILRDNPEARRRLRSRYKTVLLDEFQDTDPMQTEIAMFFACHPETGIIESGRLFLVGDPKQSIYRFRRADMVVYSQTRGALEAANANLPELALNRRSRDLILEFVNETFKFVIGAGDVPSIQPPYRPVHHQRVDALNGPGVAVMGRVMNDMPAREARRHEAEQVAAYCRLAQSDGWQVAERNGAVRSATYKDIAILVPTRAILQPLERALAAAGVPYRVEGGSLVYATQEVRDLINCLTAIDDPTDEIAVVGALRSSVYACSDVDLARHKLNGGSFNYLHAPAGGADGRVAAALGDLRSFHQRRHEGGLAGLVESFIATNPIVEAGLYDAANRNAFRRARFVIEQARSFEADGPASLRSFVVWLERRAGDAILDHEGAGLDDDEDAVRVLTIHAAKGLEFPIVFVAGLGVSPSNLTAVLGMDRGNADTAVAIGSKTRNAQFTLGPVDTINSQESRHQSAERDRLLYVAATRARDHLVMSLYHHGRARNTGAQRLIESGLQMTTLQLPELDPILDATLPPFENLRIDEDTRSEAQFSADREELVATSRRNIVTSATGLGHLKTPQAPDADDDAEKEREDDSEPWAKGRAGTNRGRAVHAALQVLPWDADTSIVDALASAQAVAEAIPEEAAEVARLLHRALATQAASRARNAVRSLREVPFAFMRGNVMLEGFIDLIIDGPDGIEIVDWKTDSITEAEVPHRLESYRLQAGLYVLGIEAATGRKVRGLTYVFVSPGVEASPGDPDELAALALGRIDALHA